MTKGQIYGIVVFTAFTTFLAAFLYAVLRWTLADARLRGRRGWPLAILMVGVPALTFLARIVLRPHVPKALATSLTFGVPLVAWGAWLLLRPRPDRAPSDPILAGREGAFPRWILVLTLVGSAYGMAVGWMAQLVDYPLYLAVPPDRFPAYFNQFNEAIVFPVIVALSFCWTLCAVLTLCRPRAVPLWSAWLALGLALLGFIASALFEFPHNKHLMEAGFDAAAIHAKITGNWYRLVPWTIQTALLAWMVARALGVRDGISEPSAD